MSGEPTLQQSVGERMDAESRSLESSAPPTQVPGYRLERLLGSGAFGQVWVAVDQNTGRRVAIKFYLRSAAMDWKLLDREVRHLVTMAADRHIVQVLAVGWDHQPPYYIMEYLAAGSLQQRLDAGKVGTAEAVRLFEGILSGLHHAHDHGILHCDLKPANILLDSQGEPRIADFGQSRTSDEQMPSLGTLFYMAPEQADLSAVPQASWDVYALGAILYTLLTGRPPYYSDHSLATLKAAEALPDRLEKYKRLLTAAPPARAHRRASIDPSLEEIIEKMIERDVDRRYGNTQQVVDAMRRRAAKRLQRPLLVLGAVGPIALLLLVATFFYRGIHNARDAAARELQVESLQSNNFAARLAARTMERDLTLLYQNVTSEATRPQLEALLRETTAAIPPPLYDRLASDPPAPNAVSQLLALEPRRALEAYVRQQFERLNARRSETAPLDSILVLDDRGYMVAAAFRGPPETSRIGWNFAFRTYFHGGEVDLPSAVARGAPNPLHHTHLSSPFLSTTTGRWKLAISTPIYPLTISGGPADERTMQPIGVLATTINLGDFNLLSGETGPTTDQFAALVDGRAGPNAGRLVQHPIYNHRQQPLTAAEINLLAIDTDQLRKLSARGLVDYRDPAGQLAEGQPYQQQFLASMAAIQLPEADADEGDRLLVIVEEPASRTVAPVQRLVGSLMREFFVAVAAMIAVSSSMAYFAFRSFRRLI